MSPKDVFSAGWAAEFNTPAGGVNKTLVLVLGTLAGLRYSSIGDAIVAVAAIAKNSRYDYSQPGLFEALLFVAIIIGVGFACVYMLGQIEIAKSGSHHHKH